MDVRFCLNKSQQMGYKAFMVDFFVFYIHSSKVEIIQLYQYHIDSFIKMIYRYKNDIKMSNLDRFKTNHKKRCFYYDTLKFLNVRHCILRLSNKTTQIKLEFNFKKLKKLNKT